MLDFLLSLEGNNPDYQDLVFFPRNVEYQISVLLSAIAATIIVLLSLILKLYKEPLGFMVLFMNFAHISFCYSKFSVVIYPPRTELHCRIITVMNIFGIESAAIWGALFAHAFSIVVKYQELCEAQLRVMISKYLLIAVNLPLISGIVASLTGHLIYSQKEGTCVHRVYTDRIDFSSNVYVFIPIWISCIASIILYKKSMTELNGLRGRPPNSKFYVLMIYPSILVLCWGPHSVAQTVLQMGASLNRTLLAVFIFMTNMQGFFDAVAYGRSIRRMLYESARNCIRRNNAREEQLGTSLPSKLQDGSSTYSLIPEEGDFDNLRHASTYKIQSNVTL